MSTKQVQVHADGCTPDHLELFPNKDKVVFVQNSPNAPTAVHVDSRALFGTTTCTVGATAAEAIVYTPQTPGNYSIGVTLAALKETGGGTIQVLCLAPSSALGAGSTGSIKVTG